MDKRPRYRPEWTETQKLLEVLAFIAIVLMWVFTLYSFAGLPESIPVHYDALGSPNGYGEKYMLFLLPLIMTGVYMLISLVSRKPWIFNYMVKITEENYREQYTSAVNMLRLLKLIIALFALYVSYGIIRNAQGQSDSLSPYALVFFLFAIFSVTGFSIYKSIRSK